MTAAVFVGCGIVWVAAGRLSSHSTICTKEDRANYDLSSLQTHVQIFEVFADRLPTNEEGLAALLKTPTRSGNYRQLLKEIPIDPWGKPYQFVRRSVVVWNNGVPKGKEGFGLYSRGPDGISNSGGNDPDDIRSW